jgi:hypothetical protein
VNQSVLNIWYLTLPNYDGSRSKLGRLANVVKRPALLLPLQEDKSDARRTELLLTEFEGSLGCDWFFEFWCGPQKPSPFVAELRECRENRQQSRCGNKLQTSMRGLSVWERGAEKPIG